MIPHRPAALLLLAVATAAVASPVRAAETFHTCSGFITSLPAVIGTQGTWCMNADLATAVASGMAVVVNTNNVTIDCNGYKLGGLQAGDGTTAIGIYAGNRSNVTVRNCNIRGFHQGVAMNSTVGGFIVEDNRFEANTGIGILLFGDGSRVRRNLVVDTGGSTVPDTYVTGGIVGIGTMDISDNQVHGVHAPPPLPNFAFGIRLEDAVGGRIAGNLVSDVFREVPGVGQGISLSNSINVAVRGNDVSGVDTGNSIGIMCYSEPVIARENTLFGHNIGLSGCIDALDNVVTTPPG